MVEIYIDKNQKDVDEYLLFKQSICRILSAKNDYIENISRDADVKFDVELVHRVDRESNVESIGVDIKNSEIFDLYTEVSKIKSETLEMHFSEEYEIAVRSGYRYGIARDNDVIVNDEVNHVTYKLGWASFKYCLFLLLNLIKSNKRLIRGYRISRLVAIDDFRVDLRSDWHELFSSLFRIKTLRIAFSDESYHPLEDYRTRKCLFVFDYMFGANGAISDFYDIDEIFGYFRNYRRRYDLECKEVMPRRRYNPDVVEYYSLALTANDAYVSYLSYYHVLEYYFDEVFKKRIVSDFQNKITSPAFSYKNDDNVYSVALFINKRFKMMDEVGRGNELESLKYVLTEYVKDINELQARIEDLSPGSVRHYEMEKVTFCTSPVIAWKDSQSVITVLAKRIYAIRNALVHSKSDRKNERYKPYKDEAVLRKELPLVRAVAEFTIVNASTLL